MRFIEVTNYGMNLPGKMLVNMDQITRISLAPDSSNRYRFALTSDTVLVVSAEDMQRILGHLKTFIYQ
jgi:hypothetical protein